MVKAKVVTYIYKSCNIHVYIYDVEKREKQRALKTGFGIIAIWMEGGKPEDENIRKRVHIYFLYKKKLVKLNEMLLSYELSLSILHL